jgi:osmotically-inducible protein OsmY
MMQIEQAESLDATPRPLGLAERAESRLRSNPYLALKNISCEFDGDVLILRGCVPSYYLKQLAQESVAALSGGKRIVNQIAVVSSGPRDTHQN